MVATSISIDAAKPDKLFYVVTTVVIYREADGRCLILKRDEREKVHPGRWAVPGGKLEHGDLDMDRPGKLNDGVVEWGDVIEKLIERETKEEAGVEIADIKDIGNLVFVRPDGIPVVLLKFGAKYVGGEVVPEPGGFTEAKWVNAVEAKDYRLIEGIAEEIADTIALFTKSN